MLKLPAYVGLLKPPFPVPLQLTDYISTHPTPVILLKVFYKIYKFVESYKSITVPVAILLISCLFDYKSYWTVTPFIRLDTYRVLNFLSALEYADIYNAASLMLKALNIFPDFV